MVQRVRKEVRRLGGLGGPPSPLLYTSLGLDTRVAHSSSRAVSGGKRHVHTPHACSFASLARFLTVLGKVGDSVGLHPSTPARAHTHTHLPPHKLKSLTSCLLASAKDETRHSLAQREEGERCESRKLQRVWGGAGVWRLGFGGRVGGRAPVVLRPAVQEGCPPSCLQTQ